MFWRVLAPWLAAQPFIVLAVWGVVRLMALRREHRQREQVGKRLAEAASPGILIVFAAPPLGAPEEAVRSAHLHALMDRTRPEA